GAADRGGEPGPHRKPGTVVVLVHCGRCYPVAGHRRSATSGLALRTRGCPVAQRGRSGVSLPVDSRPAADAVGQRLCQSRRADGGPIFGGGSPGVLPGIGGSAGAVSPYMSASANGVIVATARPPIAGLASARSTCRPSAVA